MTAFFGECKLIKNQFNSSLYVHTFVFQESKRSFKNKQSNKKVNHERYWYLTQIYWREKIVYTYISCTKLCQDAAKWPDIYLIIIWKPQNYFRSTIWSRLNIGAKMICFKTTTAKINDLHLTSTVALYQYILWLQVTMYEAKAMKKLKCLQALNCNWLQTW